MAEEKELANLSSGKSLKFLTDSKPFEDNLNSNEPFSDDINNFYVRERQRFDSIDNATHFKNLKDLNFLKELIYSENPQLNQMDYEIMLKRRRRSSVVDPQDHFTFDENFKHKTYKKIHQE